MITIYEEIYTYTFWIIIISISFDELLYLQQKKFFKQKLSEIFSLLSHKLLRVAVLVCGKLWPIYFQWTYIFRYFLESYSWKVYIHKINDSNEHSGKLGRKNFFFFLLLDILIIIRVRRENLTNAKKQHQLNKKNFWGNKLKNI